MTGYEYGKIVATLSNLATVFDFSVTLRLALIATLLNKRFFQSLSGPIIIIDAFSNYVQLIDYI